MFIAAAGSGTVASSVCEKSTKKKSYIIINIVCIFTVYFHYKQKASNTFVDIGALIRSRVTHTHAVRERETVPVSVFKYEYGLWLPCAVYRLVADETI